MTAAHKPWPEIFADAAKWPEHRVYGWKDYKKNKESSFAFIQMMRKAAVPGVVHTITLTADLVWAISKLSIELDPLFLTQQALNCRMPFQHTLFDWSGQDRKLTYDVLGVRQEVVDGHPDHEFPAFLVSEQSEGGKNLYSLSYEATDKTFIMFPLVMEMDRIVNRTVNSFNLMAVSDGHPKMIADYLFTTAVVNRHPECVSVVEDPRLHIRMMGPIAMKSARLPRNAPELLMAGTAGQFRWFGALCTLLNRPAHIRYVDGPPPDPGQKLPRPRKDGQEGPGRQQSLVLMLPRDKVVQRVLRGIEQDRKKVGLHEVMGHWCYRQTAGRTNCDHVWPNQPTRRQVCETCGQVRWWRPAHERGEGDTLKVKERRADFSGVAVERLAEAIKQGH